MMKKFNTRLGFIFLVITLPFILLQKGSAITENTISQDSSIAVTYIGGAGFLLQTTTQKVLIDAVFTRPGASGFILPSLQTVNDIAVGNKPFDNIDVYLVSHAHEDHVDPGILNSCMQNNPNARLICPQEVVDKLMALTGTDYFNYSNRITVPVLNDFQSMTTTINNIEIQVTKFPSFSYHPNGVMVFNVKINHVKTFHLMGTLLDESAYSTYSFNDPETDILLVTSNYLEGSTNILENDLHFKAAYVHHIYQYSTKLSQFKTTCSNLRTKGTPVYMLSSSLEKYRFTKTISGISIDTVDNEEVPTAITNRISDNELKIFPNPFNNFASVTFDHPDISDFTLNIYDISGKDVTSGARILFNRASGNITFFKNQLENGIYILKFDDGNNNLIKKFIIE